MSVPHGTHPNSDDDTSSADETGSDGQDINRSVILGVAVAVTVVLVGLVVVALAKADHGAPDAPFQLSDLVGRTWNIPARAGGLPADRITTHSPLYVRDQRWSDDHGASGSWEYDPSSPPGTARIELLLPCPRTDTSCVPGSNLFGFLSIDERTGAVTYTDGTDGAAVAAY